MSLHSYHGLQGGRVEVESKGMGKNFDVQYRLGMPVGHPIDESRCKPPADLNLSIPPSQNRMHTACTSRPFSSVKAISSTTPGGCPWWVDASRRERLMKGGLLLLCSLGAEMYEQYAEHLLHLRVSQQLRYDRLL